MSPLPLRHYRVVIKYAYEAVVLAENEAQALGKARALYVAHGLADFNKNDHQSGWTVEEVQP
jgi:hypothetical protein